MKKAVVMLLVVSLFAVILGFTPVRAAGGIVVQITVGSTKAYINSKVVVLDQPPIIENGRTLVPVRFIGEAFGATIGWDPVKKTVSYVLEDKNIVLTIGSITAMVNGVKTTLDVAPKILPTGRTVVPVRFISESIGAKVDWNSTTRMVTVTVAPITGTINYYTSMPEVNITALIEEFKKVQPGIKVNLYRAATGTVLAKLNAEIQGGNVVVDVLSVAEPSTSILLREQGQLLKFTPSGAKNLAEQYKDKDGYFYAFGVTDMVIIYNTQLVKDKPTGYSDMLKPEYKGKVCIGDAASSGAFTHLVGTMLQNGFGWDYFQKLKANGVVVVPGPSDVAQKVATGEVLIGITQDSTAKQMKESGSPVDYIYPAEGTDIKNCNIEILKSTKNKDAAFAWIEFLLSKETQQFILDNKIMTPVVPGMKYPANSIDPSTIKAMKLDDELLATQSADTIQKFSQIFGGA